MNLNIPYKNQTYIKDSRIQGLMTYDIVKCETHITSHTHNVYISLCVTMFYQTLRPLGIRPLDLDYCLCC